MENKILDILLLEDNESHFKDAMAEVQRRIDSGETIRVDTARDLAGYFGLTQKKRHNGIISDIFFPTDLTKPWDNLANNLVWDIMGRDYCERHSKDYRCGDERREKMFKIVQDDWMDSRNLPPTGVVIADEARKKDIPIVFCTDTYHHGLQTQPVYEHAGQKGITIIDSLDAKDGNASNKNWRLAFDEIFRLVKKR
jgi:hypothetical protein